ncbi:MAG: hypothetical protein KAH23_07555, partial [Kiritimatiellae bacterium]|nr:hypothetical protein [Kiritimatiellia bacterium]
GDTWSAKIIPSDGLEYGKISETLAVTIQSIADVSPILGFRLIDNVGVFPKDANVDDILKVEYDLFETEYIAVDDSVVIEWYHNNTAVENSNQEFIRLSMEPGDDVYAIVKLVDSDGSDILEVQSDIIVIQDVPWHLYNINVSGKRENKNLPDLSPILTWRTHKTTAGPRDKPSYLRVIVNKTDTLGGVLYDSGFLEYKKESFQIPQGTLSRGQTYYIHAAAGDSTDIPNWLYDTVYIRMAGSSWETNVSNSLGWTIEFRMRLTQEEGVASAWDNPYESGTPEYTQWEGYLNAWRVNSDCVPPTLTCSSAEIVANKVLGFPDPSGEGTESVNVEDSGFVLRRIYPFGELKFDADFLVGAVAPSGWGASDPNAFAAWNECFDTYQAMDISARKAEIARGKTISLNIHDGTYFCALSFTSRQILYLSKNSLTYTVPDSQTDLMSDHVFRIEGQGQNAWVYLDNKLVLTTQSGLDSVSNLRRLEFGDFDPKEESAATIGWFKYSTEGIRGLDNTITSSDTFYFKEVARLDDGAIEYITSNRIVWTPDDPTMSSRIYRWNPSTKPTRLVAANRSFSPISAIFIDEKRNKYIGTANGLTGIYGEKKEPDYIFTTGSSIPSSDFDRISNVPASELVDVEANQITGWLSIDTTYRSVGTSVIANAEDPYDPYIGDFSQIVSRAIHYYSQRTHGHAWFDGVDNKGWRASFSFFLEKLEADDPGGTSLEHHGFGVYVNDGTRQEILYFYEDRIRLF